MTWRVLSQDLGKLQDPTCNAVIEVVPKHQWWDGRVLAPELHVVHLERFPLGTTYPHVVHDTMRLLVRVGGPLVVDAGGVGQGPVDMYRAQGVRVVAVSITGGDAANGRKVRGGEDWRVSKNVLVGTLTALLHEGRLKIAKSLPLAGALVHELLSFEARITQRAREVYGARVGEHDDLVLAVALGAESSVQVRPSAPFLLAASATVGLWAETLRGPRGGP